MAADRTRFIPVLVLLAPLAAVCPTFGNDDPCQDPCTPGCPSYCESECGGPACKEECAEDPCALGCDPCNCTANYDPCNACSCDPAACDADLKLGVSAYPKIILKGCLAEVTICTSADFQGPACAMVKCCPTICLGIGADAGPRDCGDPLCVDPLNPCPEATCGTQCIHMQLGPSETHTLTVTGLMAGGLGSYLCDSGVGVTYWNPNPLTGCALPIPDDPPRSEGTGLTVCEADIDVGVSSLVPNWQDANEEAEADAPGVYIGVNDNYDEGKVDEDYRDPSPARAGTNPEVLALDGMRDFRIGIWPQNDYARMMGVHLCPSQGLHILAVDPNWQPGGGPQWAAIGPSDDLRPYLVGDRTGWRFYAEGISPGDAEVTFRATLKDATGADCTHSDTVHFSVVKIDANVDGDNTNAEPPFGPQEDLAEDRIEHRDDKPGRYVRVNDNDDDNDGIIDYLDGYDLDPGAPDDDTNAAERDFVKMTLKVLGPVDFSKARITAWYDYPSDPADPRLPGVPAGRMRIWKKNGSELRNPARVDAGGDRLLQTATGDELERYYEANLRAEAEAELANSASGSLVHFGPIPFPNDHSTLFASISPSWVPPLTVIVGDPGSYSGTWWSNYLNFMVDPDGFDAAGAIGKGRVVNPQYEFDVRKEGEGSSAIYRVENIRFECAVEDLYDFNYDDVEAAQNAAGVQIGYGNGNNGHSRGVIYRDRIDILHNYSYPFEER
jgi:hypothetical protein